MVYAWRVPIDIISTRACSSKIIPSIPARIPEKIVPTKGTSVFLLTHAKHLKINPSLAMAYSKRGKGKSPPFIAAVIPQRAPAAMMYFAKSAPRCSKALGKAAP